MEHYTAADEARLIDEVETQGGKYLHERHMADEIDELRYDAAGKDLGTIMSSGCEQNALFEVKYDPYAAVTVNEPILEPDPNPDAPSGRKRTRIGDDGAPLYEVVERGSQNVIDNAPGVLVVCADDDLMRNWPRFEGRMEHADPLTGLR